MGSGKNFRQEKRMMPTFYVITTAAVFVALCLIGAWVLKSPSTSRATEEVSKTTVNVKENLNSDLVSNETFEDKAGDLSLENDEKAEEAHRQQTDGTSQLQIDEKKKSFDVVAEKKEENPIDPKKSKKPSDESVSDEININVEDSEVLATEEVLPNSQKNTERSNAGEQQSELLTGTKETSDSWETQENEAKKEQKAGPKETQTADDESEEDDSNDEMSGLSKKKKKKTINQDSEEDNDVSESFSKKSEKKASAQDLGDDDDTDEIIKVNKKSKNKKIDDIDETSSKKSKTKASAQDFDEDDDDDADEANLISEKTKEKASTNDEDDDEEDDDADDTSRNSKKSDTKAADKDFDAAADDETTNSNEILKSVTQRSSGIKEKKLIQWTLCKFDGAMDYIPCLDNAKAIKSLPSNKHYEHRERHCPEKAPTCLVPLSDKYRTPIRWPQSRNEVWYANVPHPGLVSYKKDQNWVKKTNDRLIFPGGGTQFKHGALHYINYLEQSFPRIGWGKHTRVILDVGCGVASFGGYMFDKDVLTLSFAPKDEHEAQVQLALERGIPAISSVMGTQRLSFPSNVYDAVHCARCRVPWHIEGGKLLLELNRVLRPGGYFMWSATPVYWSGDEDVETWRAMIKLTKAMCWKLVAKFIDASTGIGAAIFQKPTSNYCYENRNKDFPPMCDEDDQGDAAWYTPMTACIHRIPDEGERGAEWPQKWPLRSTEAPAWLSNKKGAHSKTAATDFLADTERWQRAVQKTYLQGFGIEWKNIRNVMDMRAVYGGFAAALSSLPVWVMNVVPSNAADTLPVIFDRGLIGIYHDWCESFNSYPRTYDLLHADHLFGKLKNRCSLKSVIAEVDRLLRPGGWIIVRDGTQATNELQVYFESLHWKTRTTLTKGTEGLLAVQKTKWRPESAI